MLTENTHTQTQIGEGGGGRGWRTRSLPFPNHFNSQGFATSLSGAIGNDATRPQDQTKPRHISDRFPGLFIHQRAQRIITKIMSLSVRFLRNFSLLPFLSLSVTHYGSFFHCTCWISFTLRLLLLLSFIYLHVYCPSIFFFLFLFACCLFFSLFLVYFPSPTWYTQFSLFLIY